MNIEISPKEYERELNWHDGLLYCQLLVIDGKNDWRLPTKEELNYLYESDIDCEIGWYWSSDIYDADQTWAKYFESGTEDYGYPTNIILVRPIRTL